MTLRAEAHRQARRILACRVVSLDDLKRLQSHLEAGTIDGRTKGTCFLGVLAGDKKGGYVRLRKCVGINDVIDERQNPIELFCLSIRNGHTNKNNQRVLCLWLWTQAEIDRRSHQTRIHGSSEIPSILDVKTVCA
jgi:hypothetical protein